MIAEVDGDDVAIAERSYLAWFGDGVMVQVAPKLELRPDRVAVIDDAILVGIELRQSFESIPGQAAIPEGSEVTE
jgi:hypothetical protein